jgi:hypothetical protein
LSGARLRDGTRSALPRLPGGPALIAHFGRMPGLHDAELRRLSIETNRGTFELTAFQMTDRLDDRGSFVTTARVRVIIRMGGITRVDLSCDGPDQLGANEILGIVMEMALEEAEEGFAVDWDQSMGYGGQIEARSITIGPGPLRQENST